jgi:hypothetical protein
MRLIRNVLFGLGLFTAVVGIHGQSSFSTVPANDSIVQLAASARGLTQISPTDLPKTGTFWMVLPGRGGGLLAPMPCPPEDVSLGIFQIAGNVFLVDGTYGQNTSTNALLADAAAVANLIDQVQSPKAQRMMTLDGGLLPPGAGEGGEVANTYSFNGYAFDTNGLYLEITNVAAGWVQANLRHGSNAVYAIWGTTNLAVPFSAWQVETEVWPTNSEAMPFTLLTQDRPNLFISAEDWSEKDSNADGIPDWWVWWYFHDLTKTATDLDVVGQTLLFDYQWGLEPNRIGFALSVTNHYVNTTDVTVRIKLLAGAPAFYALLLNDTNPADATWLPYYGQDLTAVTGADGGYDISVGLRGPAENAEAAWQTVKVTKDTVPPLLVLTNPATGTVSQPIIQLQGYANEALSRIVCDVSNAAGVFLNLPVYVTGEFYDTNLLAFTTNYFQGYDVPLAEGLNRIVLHGTDLAGNTATVTGSYLLDYTGDHMAPALSLIWPQPNAAIGGSNFVAQAQVDDPTATVTAMIVDAVGNTNVVPALVERTGRVWAGSLPLGAGTNRRLRTRRAIPS